MVGLTLVTPPTASVVTVSEAKQHCQVTHSDADGMFEGWCLAADARCEDVTGRQLLTATWAQTRDRWPTCGVITLPRPNLQAVVAITYRDPQGDLQTVDPDDYVVEAFAGPHGGYGRVSLAHGRSWPSVREEAGAIRVEFVAGYGTSDHVPASIVQGLLLTIGTWWLQREDITSPQVRAAPLAARNLWRPFWVR